MLSRRFQGGVTLVELIVTITIIGVLAALAFPSFESILANAQIRAAAQALHDGLQLARAEGIRRNERVKFVLGSNSNWTVATDSGTTLQTRPAGEGSATVTVTPSGATIATFNALGRIVGNADASASLTQLDIAVASGGQPLRVTITSGGAVRLCDPNASAGDVRACS